MLPFIPQKQYIYSVNVTDLPLPESGSVAVVGMSGGVDSTLTALLLKERGCRVIGVTMSSWGNDLPLPPAADGIRASCYGPDEEIDIAQCRNFCAAQEIEYHVVDVREAYRREVLDYFKSEYRAGRTPNPCVRCNPAVKFGALLDGISAKGISFDYFCTGHYARLVRPDGDLRQWYRELAAGEQKNEPAAGDFAVTVPVASLSAGKTENAAGDSCRPVMIAGASDTAKDQTYFLCRIPSPVLEKVRFPLALYTKQQVFSMARERNLAAAARTESQDFIPESYFDILFADRPSVPGNIVDMDGRKLGTHRGIEHYTIGQRRGLGVSSSRPLYVQSIDAATNTVVLAENDCLLCNGLTADDWVWAGGYEPDQPFRAMVKIRLASKPAPARVSPLGNGSWKIDFEQPQRAVAPGQAAVLYGNNVILGGGIISRRIEV